MTIRSNATGRGFIETERRAHARLDQTLDEVEEVVDQVMREGATEIRYLIASRGVEDTIPNSDGRIGSGDMLNAVRHETVRNSRDRIRGRAGWLPGTDREKYFGWQESGTLNKGEPSGMPKPADSPPRGIRPMMAIADGNAFMADRLRDRFSGLA